MSIDRPFDIYREQLSSLYHGYALWNPNPENLYDHVSIGDVGYVYEGAFIRMFNVTLPWNDESNRLLCGEPPHYDLLPSGNFRREGFDKVDYYSRHVSREENTNNARAASPDEAEGVTYRCRGRGALLSLPRGGYREYSLQTKGFEKYIRENVASWFNWAQINQLDVDHMEDLVFVYGCTLVSSWAAAAFDDYIEDAQFSLSCRALNNGGASFVWRNIRGTVEYHNSRLDPSGSPTRKNHCVFIKCFRAKRILFWTKHVRAAAETLPDDPENSQEDEIQVARVPGVSKTRDPLIGILDYIVEKCLEDSDDEDSDDISKDEMAITYHDDLRLINDAEVLTADTVEQFLHKNEIPLLVADGATTLWHPLWQGDNHFWRPGTSDTTSTAANPDIDVSDLSSPPQAQSRNPWDLLHRLTTKKPIRKPTMHQSSVNPEIDASDISSRSQAQALLLRRSDTKGSTNGETGDQPTVNPEIDTRSDRSSRSPSRAQRKTPRPRLRRSDTRRSSRGEKGNKPTGRRYVLF